MLLMIVIVHPRVVSTRILTYWSKYYEARPGRRSSRVYAPLFKVFLETFEVAASPAIHADVSINARFI